MRHLIALSIFGAFCFSHTASHAQLDSEYRQKQNAAQNAVKNIDNACRAVINNSVAYLRTCATCSASEDAHLGKINGKLYLGFCSYDQSTGMYKGSVGGRLIYEIGKLYKEPMMGFGNSLEQFKIENNELVRYFKAPPLMHKGRVVIPTNVERRALFYVSP